MRLNSEFRRTRDRRLSLSLGYASARVRVVPISWAGIPQTEGVVSSGYLDRYAKQPVVHKPEQGRCRNYFVMAASTAGIGTDDSAGLIQLLKIPRQHRKSEDVFEIANSLFRASFVRQLDVVTRFATMYTTAENLTQAWRIFSANQPISEMEDFTALPDVHPCSLCLCCMFNATTAVVYTCRCACGGIGPDAHFLPPLLSAVDVINCNGRSPSLQTPALLTY